MRARRVVYATLAFAFSLLTGCGGGGGGVPAASITRNEARSIALGSARTLRKAARCVSLGVGTTRAPADRPARYAALFMQSLNRSRSVEQGYLADLNLYYRAVVNEADRSGRVDLYSEAARQNNAGYFAWDPPQWNGAAGQFPLSLHITMEINADLLRGQGAMDLLLNDAEFTTGYLTVRFRGAGGGVLALDWEVKQNETTGTVRLTEPGGWVLLDCRIPYMEDATAQITSSVGAHGQAVWHADLSGSLSLKDSRGNGMLTMTWTAAGRASLTYEDGSREEVAALDVD